MEKNTIAILKYGARVTDQLNMDNIFMTCCAIYNQKMIASGKDEPWQEVMSDHRDEDEQEVGFFKRMRELNTTHKVPEGNIGLQTDGSLSLEEEEVRDNEIEIEYGHDSKKQTLIEHFSYCLENKMVKWQIFGRL